MGQKVKICSRLLYDVSVKSINCVCARTNKQFILIDTPNTENEIKWCEHAILWEFEVFEDCGNCIAMEQSGYISEWQNLLLTLTSLYTKYKFKIPRCGEFFKNDVYAFFKEEKSGSQNVCGDRCRFFCPGAGDL